MTWIGVLAIGVVVAMLTRASGWPAWAWVSAGIAAIVVALVDIGFKLQHEQRTLALIAALRRAEPRVAPPAEIVTAVPSAEVASAVSPSPNLPEVLVDPDGVAWRWDGGRLGRLIGPFCGEHRSVLMYQPSMGQPMRQPVPTDQFGASGWLVCPTDGRTFARTMRPGLLRVEDVRGDAGRRLRAKLGLVSPTGPA